MNIRLNLIENSRDYIINALELYHIADECGAYRKNIASEEKKVKYKLAFVSLVQGLELLMKYGLERINPVLVYQNIDAINIYAEKTVNFSMALKRLSNFEANPYIKEENDFIIKCINCRNKYTHYTVDMRPEELKSKFSRLYTLYCKGFKKFNGEEMSYESDRLQSLHTELTSFYEDWTFYRGEEVRKDELEYIKAEIQRWGGQAYFSTSHGKSVKRIAYGEERNYMDKECISQDLFVFYEYCPDCGAKQGEYHMPDCDIERCPICKKQKLGCNCDLYLVDEELI